MIVDYPELCMEMECDSLNNLVRSTVVKVILYVKQTPKAEEAIDIDLNDPEVEKAAVKIQTQFSKLKKARQSQPRNEVKAALFSFYLSMTKSS